MGWTSYYRAPGESDRDHLQRELFDETKARIIDSTTVHGVFYGAVRMNETGETWGLVVLQQRTRAAYNYCRKEIDETMGPGDFDCPDRILDLLTPTTSTYANEWRQACRENNRRKGSLVKARRGDKVLFAHPMQFSGMVKDGYDTFEFVERSTFYALASDGSRVFRCRIPSWRNRTHTVKRAA